MKRLTRKQYDSLSAADQYAYGYVYDAPLPGWLKAILGIIAVGTAAGLICVLW